MRRSSALRLADLECSSFSHNSQLLCTAARRNATFSMRNYFTFGHKSTSRLPAVQVPNFLPKRFVATEGKQEVEVDQPKKRKKPKVTVVEEISAPTDEADLFKSDAEINPDSSRKCIGYCTAAGYNISLLLRAFNENPFGNYRVVSHGPKFIRLRQASGKGDFFIFSFGSFVSWGAEEREIEELRERLRSAEITTSTTRQKESFLFSYDKNGSNGSGAYIRNEEIIVKDDSLASKLPVAYAIAQAVKVDFFENILQETMKSVDIIPRELAEYGRIRSLSTDQLNKRMGRILMTWTQVRLDDTELFSTPDQFWEEPEQEKVWHHFSRYLDIPTRVRTIDQQLSFISDIHDGLKSEAQAKHASKLEKIIIALIAIEVAFGLADHAHYFAPLWNLFL